MNATQLTEQENKSLKIIFMTAMNMITAGKYVVDQENKQQLNMLFSYFGLQHHPEVDNRKGILLIGNPGSGKTMLLEVYQKLIRNTPMAYHSMDCIEASRQYSQYGEKTFAKWNGNYFFDDIGLETTAIHFGKKCEVMQDLIFYRYNQWKTLGVVTHFTTNMKPEEISARYGEHAWSRLQQMCNIIGLGTSSKSKDRRTQSIPVPLKNIPNFPTLFITDKDIQSEEFKKEYDAKRKVSQEMPYENKTNPLGARIKEQLGG